MKYDYRKKFDISYSRIDRWMDLSLEHAVSMAQEMTTDYFRTIDTDNVTVKTRNDALWVLTKTRLHFFRNPVWNDAVEARSYTLRSHGFRTEIETVFTREGELAFVCRQELCVIDASSREIRRIDTISYPSDMEAETEAMPIRFFRLREEFSAEDLVYTSVFRPSDIDFSNHVNNVVYVRYVVDALGKEFFEENTVEDFEIQYRHECHEGHAFEVYRKDVDGHTVDFQLRSDGNEAVDARIVYSPKTKSC